MGWKRYDWECTGCGAVVDRMIEVPHGDDAPREHGFQCVECGDIAFQRLMSAPAQYLGDRPVNMVVHGGSFDTAGKAPVPQYPEMTGGYHYEDRMRHGRMARTKVVNAEAFIEHTHTPEWREADSARSAIMKQNKEKADRLASLKTGKVDLRTAKLAGDPLLNEKRKATSTCPKNPPTRP